MVGSDPADMRKSEVMWNGKYAGRVAIYDYYNPVIAMVAIGLGIKPNELSKDHIPAIHLDNLAADHVFEHVFRTPQQMHTPLEPHVAVDRLDRLDNGFHHDAFLSFCYI